MNLSIKDHRTIPAREVRVDATSAAIIAVHAAALLLFFFNPMAGLILLGVGVAAAVGITRPLPVALFSVAMFWSVNVLADFFPMKQYTAWKDVFLVLIIIGWMARNILLRRTLTFHHPITYPILLLIAFYVVLSALTPSFGLAVLGWKATIFYTAWFFVLPDIVRTRDNARQLVMALLFGTLCCGCYDLWRVQMPFGTFPPTREGKMYNGMMQVHFSGTSVLLTLGFLMGVAVAPRFGGWKRLFVYAAVVAGLGGILVSGARSAWGLILVCIIAMAVVSRRTQVLVALVIALVFAGVIQSHLKVDVSDRAASAFDTQDESREQREAELSSVTLPFVLSHPLGAGTGTMSARGSIKVFGGSPTDLLLQKGFIHNGFLLVAIEIGWLGLATYVWLLLALIFSALRSYYKLRDPFLKDTMLGLFAVMIFFSAMNFAAPALTIANLNFPIWVLIGLLPILPRLDTPEDAAGASGLPSEGDPSPATVRAATI